MPTASERQIPSPLKAWMTHGGPTALVIFLATLVFLPVWPWITELREVLAQRVWPYFSGLHTLGTTSHTPFIYDWLLAGLIINTGSIVLAIFAFKDRSNPNAVYSQNITALDRMMVAIYTVVGALSVGLILFLPAIHSATSVFVVYYGLYTITDLAGLYCARKNRYERAKYILPLCCLDLPALATSIIIAVAYNLDAVSFDFADGMAAGHLVLGSFAYFGIVGMILPLVLHKIAEAEASKIPAGATA